MSILAFGQKEKQVNDPVLSIYKILSNEGIHLKDSLAIYALNFEIDISKKEKITVVTNITANDSLAFKLFPSYKSFYNLDFSSLMIGRNKIKLVVPILIYEGSPEKITYRDKDGNPLISFNAAVNAAYALYSPLKYSNQNDANVPIGHRLYKSSKDKNQKVKLRELMIIEPIHIEIFNVR